MRIKKAQPLFGSVLGRNLLCVKNWYSNSNKTTIYYEKMYNKEIMMMMMMIKKTRNNFTLTFEKQHFVILYKNRCKL
jgi:hypothetical protein